MNISACLAAKALEVGATAVCEIEGFESVWKDGSVSPECLIRAEIDRFKQKSGEVKVVGTKRKYGGEKHAVPYYCSPLRDRTGLVHYENSDLRSGRLVVLGPDATDRSVLQQNRFDMGRSPANSMPRGVPPATTPSSLLTALRASKPEPVSRTMPTEPMKRGCRCLMRVKGSGWTTSPSPLSFLPLGRRRVLSMKSRAEVLPLRNSRGIRTRANLDTGDAASQTYIKALDSQIFKDIGKGATVGSLATPVGVVGATLGTLGMAAATGQVAMNERPSDAAIDATIQALSQKGGEAFLRDVLGHSGPVAIRAAALVELAGGWSAFSERVKTDLLGMKANEQTN